MTARAMVISSADVAHCPKQSLAPNHYWQRVLDGEVRCACDIGSVDEMTTSRRMVTEHTIFCHLCDFKTVSTKRKEARLDMARHLKIQHGWPGPKS